MKLQWRWLNLVVLTVLLAACGPAGLPSPIGASPMPPSAIASTVAGQPTIGQSPVSSEIPSSVATPAPTSAITLPVSPTTSPIIPSPQLIPTVGITVGILVVDSFLDPGRTIPRSFFETEETQGSCIVHPDGQHYTAGGVGTGPDHGNAVYNDLAGYLENKFSAILLRSYSGTEYFGENVSWIPRVEEWQTPDGLAVLVAVDSGGFTTKIAADRIHESDRLLGSKGISMFVINMSFALIPCGTVEFTQYRADVEQYPGSASLIGVIDAFQGDPAMVADRLTQSLYESNPDPTLAQARLEAAYSPANKWFNQKKENLDSFADEWIKGNLFSVPGASLTPDPLYEEIQRLQLRAISVAAAANSGADFPYAPAMWKGVVSVSASAPNTSRGITGRTTASYSNVGEVHMDGITKTGEGTSFAAPKFSAWAAHYLLRYGSQPNPHLLCSGTSNPSTPLWPPLNYADEYTYWMDKSIDQAASEYCTSFFP